MVQLIAEIPDINNLTCRNCPFCDSEYDCNLDYAINGKDGEVSVLGDTRPENCPIKHISVISSSQ